MLTPKELLRAHNIELPSYQPGRYYTTCPECSKNRKPGHQSYKCLGVTITDDGRTYWGCNHCEWSGPRKGTGDNSELINYLYRDREGVVRFRKVRNRPGKEPRFWLERPDGKGGWINGASKESGVDTSILYRADGVDKAIRANRTIGVVEGEKDANNLWRLDMAATCNAHGASEVGKKPKWTKEHSEQLRGADIVVFNDNDGAGYAHADAVCRSLLDVAKRVRRLDLKNDWPEIPEGGDVSDWLAVAEHTSERLKALIEAAPEYRRPSEQTTTSKDNKAVDDDAELERLARLPALDYERGRKEAAEILGARATLLDKLVAAKRDELGLDEDDSKQGHAIAFAEPEPWSEAVQGAELLDAVASAIRAHVIMTEHDGCKAALWVAHTYLLDRLMISPRLAITSPTKGCGKTTLLDVLGELVNAAARRRELLGRRHLPRRRRVSALLADRRGRYLRWRE
jgi:hypothetical protein